MLHDMALANDTATALAEMGTNAVAYMRKISGQEMSSKFAGLPDELKTGATYWALFAANGTPLMVSNDKTELANSAYFNDLQAILPN